MSISTLKYLDAIKLEGNITVVVSATVFMSKSNNKLPFDE